MTQYAFNIEVAGLNCLLEFNDPEFVACARDYFYDFISRKEPELFIKARLKKKGKYHPPINLESPTKEERYFINLKGHQVEMFDCMSQGLFDLKKSRGELTFSNFFSFRNFIRACYAFQLLKINRLMLHSSGIIWHDKGILFSGPAGEGKSTAMELSGEQTLNEEINILSLEKGRVFVQSTPFGGRTVANKKKELGMVFFIKKNNKTFARNLVATEKISNLICNEFLSMQLIFKENPTIVRKLFHLARKLGSKIEAREMHFTKSRDFVKLLPPG